MHQPSRTRLCLTGTLAALWLSGCGGGDGGGPISEAPPPMGLLASAAPQVRAAAVPTWNVAYPNPQIWHSLSSNSTGDVLAAGTAGGAILVSSDAGATWSAGNSPTGIWISSAMSATGNLIFAVQYGVGMYKSAVCGLNAFECQP